MFRCRMLNITKQCMDACMANWHNKNAIKIAVKPIYLEDFHILCILSNGTFTVLKTLREKTYNEKSCVKI